jgi:DNA gyrase/topoisomerase IV subunit B
MATMKKYVKKDPISHILDRSDMYVGSTREKTCDEFIAIEKDKIDENDIGYEIVKKSISYAPAILRIFIEVLSNAIDNVERSKKQNIPCTFIKVNINKETGETCVWNDGDIIPIEMNETEKMYNHTLIFGNLLTGSNYDDTEERLVSGRNGVGGKCTNVFSTSFTVEGVDPNNKKKLVQTWTNNMRNTNEPEITSSSLKKGYTKVTYFPEFERFGIKGYTDDIYHLYLKYILDTAMLSKVKVYFNENLIPIKDLSSYAKLYNASTDESLMIKTATAEVLLTTSNEDFQTISFVNGIFTRLGGVHVDAWSEALFRPLVEKFNTKKKEKPSISIKDIKTFFKLFVVATVVNPEFGSQEKDKLEAPKIEAIVKTTDINKICKWSVIEEIQETIRAKEMINLKKNEKKKKGYTKVEGLDNANFAGTKQSQLCTLILCEGLSAKTYASAGIDKGVFGLQGRNYFGILALRGKCVSPETKIVLYNGEVKQAKDVKIGDYLINENGEKTEVLELFSGEDEMYEIQQDRGENYVVNSQHTLSLKLIGNNKIRWLSNKNCWSMVYYDTTEKKAKTKNIFCEEQNMCNKDQGFDLMLNFKENINSPEIIDIDISDYLKTDQFTKELLKGFKSEISMKQFNKVYLQNSLETSINVIHKGFGKYVGFMTDKTHRFLLNDFTVTHNCLNVRNSSISTIAKNQVITDIIQALGLTFDMDYTDDKNFETLRYGKLMVLTDADVGKF